MRKPRYGGHEEGGGHDSGGMMRWLLTYADMITLLTAFFIMMYSMSVLNLQKFKQVAMSVRSGFGGDTGGAGLVDKGGVVYAQDKDNVPSPGPTLKAIMRYLNKYILRHNLKDVVQCRLTDRGLVISLTSDGLLFEKGRAAICPQARAVLHDMAVLLNRVQNEILVEGHTCDLPISTAEFPSNWELSTARATAVVRYLIANEGISARRIGAAGYADSRPFSPNTSEANRRLNRRVDVVIMSGLASVIRNAQTAPAAGPPYTKAYGEKPLDPKTRQELLAADHAIEAEEEQGISSGEGRGTLRARGGPLGTAPPVAVEAGRALKEGRGLPAEHERTAVTSIKRVPAPAGKH